MKTRIIGSILIIIILGGLFLVTNPDFKTSEQPQQSTPMNNESSFKSLSVN